MKVFETVELFVFFVVVYEQLPKVLHHCVHLQPKEQQGTGEYRKEVNDRERKGVQAGEGCWVRPWLNPRLFSCVLQINKTK